MDLNTRMTRVCLCICVCVSVVVCNCIWRYVYICYMHVCLYLNDYLKNAMHGTYISNCRSAIFGTSAPPLLLSLRAAIYSPVPLSYLSIALELASFTVPSTNYYSRACTLHYFTTSTLRLTCTYGYTYTREHTHTSTISRNAAFIILWT